MKIKRVNDSYVVSAHTSTEEQFLAMLFRALTETYQNPVETKGEDIPKASHSPLSAPVQRAAV